jgi:hypothetical protein
MWYLLIVGFLAVTLFVGYKCTLFMDKYLDRKSKM